MQIFQTSVETLGLVSLREVRNGHIYIANNSRLCYASSVNWHNIRMSPKQTVLIQYNRNQSQCGKLLDVVFVLFLQLCPTTCAKSAQSVMVGC